MGADIPLNENKDDQRLQEPTLLSWQENGKTHSRFWFSESRLSPPKIILIATDATKADEFYRKASEGAAFLYRGDFQNAKQLLQAVQRRIDKKKQNRSAEKDLSPKEEFHRFRQAQAHRAQLLSRLLLEVNADFSISMGRAPDLKNAFREVYSNSVTTPFLVSLRELLGYVGAHEWRKKGLHVPALNATIYPHYGIFAPVRSEYLNLLATAPIPTAARLALDIGTGTGVLAMILAHRGLEKIIATDTNPRAIACARENIDRLNFRDKIQVVNADLFPGGQTDLFPGGRADLLICNPPWLPGKATSSLEHAIYDENSSMLKGFLSQASSHLTTNGEVWLVMSNLAELLGLREPNTLKDLFAKYDLVVIDEMRTRPDHKKATDETDPLAFARSQEVTSLWRLKTK